MAVDLFCVPTLGSVGSYAYPSRAHCPHVNVGGYASKRDTPAEQIIVRRKLNQLYDDDAESHQKNSNHVGYC